MTKIPLEALPSSTSDVGAAIAELGKALARVSA